MFAPSRESSQATSDDEEDSPIQRMQTPPVAVRGIHMKPVLRKFIVRVRALIRLEDGQDLVEYAMIIALITTGATAGMKGLAVVLLNAMVDLSNTLGSYTV
jgi:Flp pilus assembly pilin Flp